MISWWEAIRKAIQHKYIRKFRKNGKWVYVYPEEKGSRHAKDHQVAARHNKVEDHHIHEGASFSAGSGHGHIQVLSVKDGLVTFRRDEVKGKQGRPGKTNTATLENFKSYVEGKHAEAADRHYKEGLQKRADVLAEAKQYGTPKQIARAEKEVKRWRELHGDTSAPEPAVSTTKSAIQPSKKPKTSGALARLEEAKLAKASAAKSDPIAKLEADLPQGSSFREGLIFAAKDKIEKGEDAEKVHAETMKMWSTLVSSGMASPGTEGAKVPTLADGSVKSIQDIHEQYRSEFGFKDIDPFDIEARKASVEKKLGRTAIDNAEDAMRGWTVSSNPFSGSSKEGRSVRFASIALGMTDMKDETEALQEFYGGFGGASNESIRRYIEEYKEAVTPGTWPNKTLKALIAYQVIWADHQRAQGKAEISVSRGLKFEASAQSEAFAQAAKSGNLASSSAASFTESSDIAAKFTGKLGAIIRAKVPLEHCLLGHQVSDLVGTQPSKGSDKKGAHHEQEIVVGTLKAATYTIETKGAGA